MFNIIKKKFTYTRIIALSFAVVILIGSVLLTLPVSSRDGSVTPFIDSLFTAVSSTCVTGLSVYDTYSHWSLFGQIVILCMIQIGGLGFMTIIVMLSLIRKKGTSLHERRLLMQSAGSIELDGVNKLLKNIFAGTFIFEFIGAVLLSIRFCGQMNFGQGIWYAVFHSISAFCNAGFDLMGQFGNTSFSAYSDDWLVNLTLIFLITMGGLGFLVWNDLLKNKFHFRNYSLHTKIVLSTSAILLIGGTVIFFFTERNHAFSNMSTPHQILCSFFQSATTRTAGFLTVDQSELSNSGSIVSALLMFVGGSSGSTAGGIKTTTFAVFLISNFCFARNNDNIVVFKKRLDTSAVKQAGSIVCVYISLVLVSSFIVCIAEPLGIREVFYETISAIATVGLSMNITPTLGTLSKIIIAMLMYTGRIGGMSMVMVLAEKKDRSPLERPVGKILIG
ncbi:MAG: TrkH family potassium uptake protein [Ruminococcus sp.]|nr:TrkH family potassium uptake protein [Ruminococcus sp.]